MDQDQSCYIKEEMDSQNLNDNYDHILYEKFIDQDKTIENSEFEYRSLIKTEAIYNTIDNRNEELAEQITYFSNDDSGIDLKLEYQLQNVSSEKTLEEDSFLSTEHDAEESLVVLHNYNGNSPNNREYKKCRTKFNLSGPKDQPMCSKCGKTFKSYDYSRHHEKFCGKLADLNCKFCGFKTRCPSSLKSHLRIHRTDLEAIYPNENITGIFYDVTDLSEVFDNPSTSDNLPKILVDSPKLIEAIGKTFKKKKVWLNKFQRICLECKLTAEAETTFKICQNCKIDMQYQCLTCKKVYSIIHCLYNHLRRESCSTLLNYYCNYCGHKSSRKGYLKFHIFSKHMYKFDKKGFTKCNQCNKKYKSWREMSKHENVCRIEALEGNNHENDGKMNDSSDTDSENVETSQIIRRTMTEEEKLETSHLVKIYCPKCELQNERQSNKTTCCKCERPNMYYCLHHLCGMQFKSLYYIRAHIKRQHLYGDRSKLFECSSCKMTFGYYENLHKHKKICGKKPDLACNYCHYKAKRRDNLNSHILHCHRNIIAADQIYTCKNCHKIFLEAKSLKIHENRFCKKNGPTFRCTKCNYITNSRLILIAHLKTEQHKRNNSQATL